MFRDSHTWLKLTFLMVSRLNEQPWSTSWSIGEKFLPRRSDECCKLAGWNKQLGTSELSQADIREGVKKLVREPLSVSTTCLLLLNSSEPEESSCVSHWWIRFSSILEETEEGFSSTSSSSLSRSVLILCQQTSKRNNQQPHTHSQWNSLITNKKRSRNKKTIGFYKLHIGAWAWRHR